MENILVLDLEELQTPPQPNPRYRSQNLSNYFGWKFYKPFLWQLKLNNDRSYNCLLPFSDTWNQAFEPVEWHPHATAVFILYNNLVET